MLVVLLVALVLLPASVAQAAVTKVEARDFDATAGQQFSGVVGTFEDDQVPSAADFTATIAWGDGSESAGTITCTDCGPNDPAPYVYEVRGAHTYAGAGNRTFTLTVDNPSDDPPPAVSDTGTARVAAAGQPPPTTPTPPEPKPSSPPAPPVAKLELVGPPPPAGGMLTLSAAGSTPAPGKTIVAYLWDLNGDGDFEANTGTRPTATYLAGGTGRYGARVAVIDSAGLRGESGISYEVSKAVTGCENGLDVGKVRLRASCIKRPGGAEARAAQAGTLYEVNGVIDFNGLEIAAPGKLTYDFAKGTITGDAGLSVKLKNTPIGDVIIYRKAGKVTWQLPVKGVVPTGKEFHLVTIGAGSGCTAGERAYCAKLPGNFPMTGTIDVFLTSAAEIKLNINASLSTPFTVTGKVAVRMVPKEGIKLDSLFFRIANAKFGIFTLEELRFLYEGPGTGDPFHAGELWEVAVDVRLPTVPESKVEGELRFIGGEFDYGRAVLTIPGGIPVGPGMLLNHFEGEFGLTPTRIGGGLGVSLAAAAQVNGRFAYESSKGVANLHVGGDFALLGAPLATAYFDYWSTGYVAFGGQFGYRWPQEKPILFVTGKVDAWFEGSRFQVEGDVGLKVWIIDARVRVIANNDFLAGCASVRIIWKVEGYASLNLRNGKLDYGLGCNMGAWRIKPLNHAGPPARAAQAGVATLQVGRDEEALGIELTGRGGPPVVTLVGPSGERYTTPATPEGRAGEEDRWAAVQAPDFARTIVRVVKPSPGVWRIEPEAGSPAIEAMRTAGDLPDPRVRARLEGRGARRLLRYAMVPAPGRRVRLVERGATSLQEVCVITRASGTCPFRPDAGSRARRIEATVEQDGMPRQTVTVARFTAPSGRPGKPSKVRIVRRGSRAIVTWRGVRGARGYRVAVSSNDGRRELMLPRRPRVVVSDLVAQDTVRVRVQAEAGTARITGPAATGSLGAVKPRRRRG